MGHVDQIEASIKSLLAEGVNGGVEMLNYGGIKVLRPISTYPLSI